MSSDWKPRRKFVDPQKLSRKVFDAHVDRVEVKRKRDRDDHRADMQALIHRLINLEQALQDLAEHVAQHCLRMDPALAHVGVSGKGNEGLG